MGIGISTFGAVSRMRLWTAALIALCTTTAVHAQKLTLTPSGPEGGEWQQLTRTADGTLLAATGERSFRSTDNGLSWTPFVIAQNGFKITLLKSTPAGVLSLKGSLRASDDNGLTWRICAGGIGSIIDVVHDGAQTLYALTLSGLWASTDGCRSFSQRRADTQMSHIAATPTEVFWTRTNSGDVTRSTDGGVSGTTVATLSVIFALHVTGSGAVLVADGYKLYRRDPAQSAFVLQQTLTLVPTRFASDGTRVVAMGFGGIAYSSVDGAYFSNWSLPTGAQLGFSGAFAADGATVVVGTASNLMRAASLGGTLVIADAGITARSIKGVSNAGGITYTHTFYELSRSTNGGASWVRANEGLVPGHNTGDIAQDPAGNAFLAGSFELFRRDSSASTWTQVRSSGVDSGKVAAADEAGRIHFGTSSAIYRSVDSGVTATAATFSSGVVSGPYLKVGPSGLVFSASSSSLARSVDGGVSFTTLSAGLPSPITLSSLAIDRQSGRAWLLDSTSVGLFDLEPMQSTWSPVALPASAVLGARPRVIWAGPDRVLVASDQALWIGRGTPARMIYEQARVWPASCGSEAPIATSATLLRPGEWLLGTSNCSTVRLFDAVVFADDFE